NGKQIGPDVRERAVAIIAINAIDKTGIAVASVKQIQIAIVVVIAPNRKAEVIRGQAGIDVGEIAAAIIVPDAGDQAAARRRTAKDKIGMTVVVVIPPRRRAEVTIRKWMRHRGEHAIAVIMI